MIFDYTFNFGDNAALVNFFGDHAMAHATYAPLLLSKFGKARSTTFDVSDQGALFGWIAMNEELRATRQGTVPEALENWLQFHNAMHQSEAELMGVTSLVDLSAVDFRDPDDFYNWMNTHYQVHALENSTLGI